MLIGTIPPPSGGDAIWAEHYLNFYRNQGEDIPLINTSLIGRRALAVDEHLFFIDEFKRCLNIWTSIIKTLRKFSPEIVHMNINCSPLGTLRDLISAILVKINNRKLVLHCHCNIEDQIGKRKIYVVLLSLLFNQADGIIVLNSKSYKYCKNMCNKKIKQIPNFISERFSDVEKKISEEITTVLYAGHIRKTKGIDEILQTAKFFPHYRFVLVGPITEDYPQYMPKKMYDNVYFTGGLSHDEVIKKMDEADVFLFPSYTEGFSVALLEAMSRGLPCVATDVGANRDMIENYGGIIILQNDPIMIRDALDKMKNKEDRKQMSCWNKVKVKERYAIETVMKNIESFYKEICDEVV